MNAPARAPRNAIRRYTRKDFLYDMQHAGRNSVGASHRDHLRRTTIAANDPSFTATATSIRLKWRRDSAKRDAKQVPLLSRTFPPSRNDIVTYRTIDTYTLFVDIDVDRNERARVEDVNRTRKRYENLYNVISRDPVVR